jgi:multidrug resistance efflux pump
MKHPPRALIVPVLLLVLGGLGYWFFFRPTPAGGPLLASGTIEADEVTVASELSGRLVSLDVDEGAHVDAGQTLGHLADPVLEVQLRQSVIDPAQHQVMQAQMDRLTLRSPLSGVVQKRLVLPGEVVAPGTPILTVANPRDLHLTVYVLEAELGRVNIGQSVAVRSDAFADRVFGGKVQTIASHAEFTPRNVQTQRDRQNLVFAVKVRLPNGDGALKAGLPADAMFEGS